jgi:D-proline reductase (dithiol) PrdB
MAALSDLKLANRIFMLAYRYRRVDWSPGARLTKPLSEARIAVVTTAGFFAPNQRAFNPYNLAGDYSYRVVPAETELNSLKIAHRSDAFDVRGITADKNLALPLDRLRSLEEDGVIGSVAPRHFSFMGSIPAPGRLMKQTAPEVAAALVEDRVDAVLLTPV